jgi:hypothetical protein
MLLQSPEDLGSPFSIQAHTDQLAGIGIQRPVAPTVLPYGHTTSPLEVGQSVCPAQCRLLAFAPALSELVGPP